jgi:hypothetical protein
MGPQVTFLPFQDYLMFSSNRSLMRLALTSAVALLAACSAADQATAPAVRHSARPVGAPSLDVITNAVAPDSLSADFTVTPSGGMFALGNNAVYFPAGSICDPETSSYGPGHWDEPCTPLDHSIDFHAEVRHDAVSGQSWVDFTPAVRFVPTDDPNQTVWMLMKAGVDVTDDNYFGLAMQWMPTGSPDLAVDEASTDSTLKTYVDIERDVVFRRVKHFSGYLVVTQKADAGMIDDIIPLF